MGRGGDADGMCKRGSPAPTLDPLRADPRRSADSLGSVQGSPHKDLL